MVSDRAKLGFNGVRWRCGNGDALNPSCVACPPRVTRQINQTVALYSNTVIYGKQVWINCAQVPRIADNRPRQ